ncbi:hypothetical protein SynBIOSE41_01578 [Synechococcus sp. BIOS-E4-1]|nr:hypothetical protein SynBIOSE41_01578 [Synechococcus sp. BIOS-E4-1]
MVALGIINNVVSIGSFLRRFDAEIHRCHSIFLRLKQDASMPAVSQLQPLAADETVRKFFVQRP